MLFWGMTFGVVGKVLLGLAVVFVHHKVVKEHKIDRKVLTEMRRERNIALIGIALIVIGYFLEVQALGLVGNIL